MKAINQYAIFIALALALNLAGCAHQKSVDSKVDQELESQPAVGLGRPLAAESRKLITESPVLTQDQKDKLLSLHDRMAGEMTGFRREESRLKMVFFKDLLDPKSDEAEIANLKKRILDLDRKKTNRMLSAFDEARTILGRENLDSDRLFRAFLFDRPGSRGDF